MSQSSTTPRRGRFRFLYQYRLRTLLVVTAAVAVFCNWYFQPQRHDELLAGGKLKIHKQMKVLSPEEYDKLRRPNGWGGKTTEPISVEHGLWELLDEHELTLVRGTHRDGEPSGRWRGWYPSGQKSAEGMMRDGVPAGLWRTWHENGQLKSEATIGDRTELQTRATIRVEYYGTGSKREGSDSTESHSFRHGPARAWHANGNLRYEGQFEFDLPQGIWTFYDEQGKVTTTGLYLDGQRHGPWMFAAAGAPREVLYFHGYRHDELKDYYTQLTAGLLSPQRYRRLEAANGLAELGPAAVPLLVKIIDADDPVWTARGAVVPPGGGDAARSVPATYLPSGKECAVQTVWKLGPVAKDTLPGLARLATNVDALLAEQSRVAVFVVDASMRSAEYGQLVASVSKWTDHDAALEALVRIYCHDVPRRKETFRAIARLVVSWPKAEQERAADRLAMLPGNVLDYLHETALSNDIKFRLLIPLITKSIIPQSWSLPPERQKQLDGLIDRLRNDINPEISTIGNDLYELRQPRGGGFGGGGFGGGGGGGLLGPAP